MQFSHLHTHTQFSLLDGAASIKKLFDKAEQDQMNSLAITDHGNMLGVFNFVAEAWKRKDTEGKPKIKPIVGCEFYLVEDRHKRQFTREEKDKRFHQLLLAKNEIGYKNLSKLCSLGFIEGLYGKYPRIDKELLEKYSEGLIATSCCIGAEIPQAILRDGEDIAEEKLKWWLDLFGDDFYLEIQRHGMPEEEKINQTILKFSEKYNIPVIATNDSHYVDREDFNAHDILLCINTGEKQSTPANRIFSEEDVKQKNTRFAFFNDEFYFKTQSEMKTLFKDVPHAIANTQLIHDKVGYLNLKKDILLPNFPLPKEFTNQDEYLEHLTWEGAYKRYIEMTAEIEERIRFELNVIKTMGFAGYFLIVSDFILAGKNMGVFIGPGRGSAAGSVVAFCIGITNIDPIKYNLLFERFLNPDRKSMPDIDTDFDDEGRQKVIDYVVEKYSKNQVAQIVTYGTMAAKMSIKDVSRVLDLPLANANFLAKLVPDTAGIKLEDVLHTPLDDEKLSSFNKENLTLIREYYNSDKLEAEVLHEAEKLEGSVRNTGIHAAGIIIAPEDLTNLLPVQTNKDTHLLITQYEGKIIEDAGVIKMDFLGLKTLTILKNTLTQIKKNHDVDIDLDTLPLDDEKTFEIYAKGFTNGIFQFESAGMQKYMKDLKPDKLDDLIAMNALYRPGPLEYIPNFINRKFGREKIEYDLEGMEEFLEETYGITVYQEQVMLLSQKIANFSKGDADVLRKAMGKKLIDVLAKMKGQFIEGGKENKHPEEKLEKVWKDWEAFAQYAFNKSHSTCYAILSYQTAYLKAHYPSEFMAALLNNANAIEKITFFLKECQRMEIKVLGPDINESDKDFSANKEGVIRFGFGGIKGVGEAVVDSIIEERNANGKFKNIYDFIERINLRTVNKKAMESLAMGGAFDEIDTLHRAQFIGSDENGTNSAIELLLKYGKAKQNTDGGNALTLFGDAADVDIDKPKFTPVPEWSMFEKLNYEKDVLGLFISGHPLDKYSFEFKYYNVNSISAVHLLIAEKNNYWQSQRLKFSTENEFKKALKDEKTTIRIIGTITEATSLTSQSGNQYMKYKITDIESDLSLFLFSENFYTYGNYIKDGVTVLIDLVIQSNYKKIGDFEANVNRVLPIEKVKSNLTKKIKIRTFASLIDSEFLNLISNNISNNSNIKTDLIFSLYDSSIKNEITLKSDTYTILLNDDIIEFLESNENIELEITSY